MSRPSTTREPASREVTSIAGEVERYLDELEGSEAASAIALVTPAPIARTALAPTWSKLPTVVETASTAAGDASEDCVVSGAPATNEAPESGLLRIAVLDELPGPEASEPREPREPRARRSTAAYGFPRAATSESAERGSAGVGHEPPAAATEQRAPREAREGDARDVTQIARAAERADATDDGAPTTEGGGSERAPLDLPVAPGPRGIAQPTAAARPDVTAELPAALRDAEPEVLDALTRLRATGESSAAVKLEHPALGTLRIELGLRGDGVDVRIVAESSGAAIALRESEKELRERFGARADALRVRIATQSSSTPRSQESRR